jgi:hypothetical protein
VTVLAFLLGLTLGLPAGILLAGLMRATERPAPTVTPPGSLDTLKARRWL